MSLIPLLNRIRTSDLGKGLRPPRWMEAHAQDRAEWRKHLDLMLKHYLRDSRLPAFNLDDVAQYYFVDNPQEYWDVDDLRGLKAPYPACWMESLFPGRIHSEIGDQDASDLGRIEVGWLVFHSHKSNIAFHPAAPAPSRMETALILQRFEYYGLRGPWVTGPDGMIVLALDPAGSVLGKPMFQSWASQKHAPEVELLQAGMHIPLLACSRAERTGKSQGPTRPTDWVMPKDPPDYGEFWKKKP